MDVALVTWSGLPDLFEDDRPLARALAAAGLDVGIVRWDDSDFDWTSTAVALLRSPWDYYRRADEFLAWAARAAAATRLVNPLPLVRWNLHKGYLIELAASGAPVVPTALLRRAANYRPDTFAHLVAERGWGDTVVKPAISADSWETIVVRTAAPERGEEHLARLLPERDMLVQPFLPSVETYGERCLVFLDGVFSHAVRKNALTQGGRWTELPEGAPVEAAEDELAAAERVLAAAGAGRALYARVDLTRDAAGDPLLLELELAEPTLFLAERPAAIAWLVRRLAELVQLPPASISEPSHTPPGGSNCE